MDHIEVSFEGASLGFDVNDRGIIDATNYFHAKEFMDGGPAAWTLSAVRVVALLLHHSAGWYGQALTEKATVHQEFAQLVAMARDHRARFGVGPAYNVAVFPSGRRWAIGKHGTHRAHTAGRDPVSRERWNEVGRALVVMGDYEAGEMSKPMQAGVCWAVADMLSWRGVEADVPIHEHGLTPTVNSDGMRYSQGTACPGRYVAAWRAAGGLVVPGQTVPAYQPDLTDAAFGRGYLDGYRTGYGKGAAAAYDLVHANDEAAMRLVSSPPPAVTVPPTPADLKVVAA